MSHIKKGWALTDRIRQREAFPALDLIAAKKAMDHIEAAVCVFSLHRKMVGQLFIPDVQDDSLTVHYNISTKHVSGVGEFEFNTKTINSPLDSFRRFLYCPGCDRLCSKVHLCNTWACAKCHGLHYRRQLIDKDVARWERRQELQEFVGHGRPKGMHNPTYIALREELYRLQFKLRGRARKWASCEHDLIIQAQWMAGSGIDLWSSQYAVRGGDFVRVGETFAPRRT